MDQNIRLYAEPVLQDSTIIVAWSKDAGMLGASVIDYMNHSLDGKKFAEIEPGEFFPLGGVSVENNVAQFPESRFYWSEQSNLVLFESDVPNWGWNDFLNIVLDIAQRHCNVKQVYTIGGIVSVNSHTMPRQSIAISNSDEIKQELNKHGLLTNLDYETQPGGRPTISSYLLWVARERGISGASIWIPVPFYLVSTEDSWSWMAALRLLDHMLHLGIGFKELEERIAIQEKMFAEILDNFPELVDYIHKLEGSFSLTQEESETLVRVIEEALKKRS